MDWKRRSEQPQGRYEPDEGDTFQETDFIDASSYQPEESDFVDASTYQRQPAQRAAAPAADQNVYDQTVVDPVFAERGRVRRERQGSSFNTQRLGGGTGGGRRFPLAAVLGVLGLVALGLIALLWFLSGNNTDPLAGASPSPTVVVNRSPSPSPSASPSASPTPTPSPSPSPSPSAAANVYVVTGTDADGINVRQGPSTTAAIVATLPEGTRVESTGTTTNADGRDWRQISAPQAGWVAAEFLQPAQQ